jgi:predicted dehydrogenase
MKKVRTAVVGYGHLGKWHCQKVEAHSEVAELAAIVEKFPTAQAAAHLAHPGIKIVDNLSDILDEIDAAIVVTPTSTHFELVKYLLENNKHVFCEKPLCSNSMEAEALKKIASSKAQVLQVGHSERFHEAWEIIGHKLHNLRPPFSIRINRVAPFKGRATDVDVIQDLAIHDLDLVLHLFKSRPLRVRAQGYKIRTGNYDHASIQLELEGGSLAQIVVSRNAVREQRDLEVTSSDGMIYVDLFANKILEASSSNYPDGSFIKEQHYHKRDHLYLEHKYFYQSILEKKSAVVGLSDGLMAVGLVDCCLRAIESKEAVVVNIG